MEERTIGDKGGLSAVRGQQRVINELKIITKAAKMKGKAVGHILLSGYTEKKRLEIALAVAEEMETTCRTIYGDTIIKPGEMAATLNSSEEGEILIIEDFDKMRSDPKDVLIRACRDFAIDIMIGKDRSARSMRMNIPHFTLIATVENSDKLIGEQRLIFDYFYELDPFNTDECKEEIKNFLARNSFNMSSENIEFVSSKVQSLSELQTYLKWVENLANIQNTNEITGSVIAEAEEHVRLSQTGETSTH